MRDRVPLLSGTLFYMCDIRNTYFCYYIQSPRGSSGCLAILASFILFLSNQFRPSSSLWIYELLLLLLYPTASGYRLAFGNLSFLTCCFIQSPLGSSGHLAILASFILFLSNRLRPPSGVWIFLQFFIISLCLSTYNVTIQGR